MHWRNNTLKTDHIIRTALIQIRIESKLSQAELAQRLGVSRQTVYNIEKGIKGHSWLRYLPKTMEWFRACNCYPRITMVPINEKLD